MASRPRSRSVRIAARLFGVYAGLLALEAVWVSVLPQWSVSAGDWAGSRPSRHALQLVLGAVVGSLVCWFLLQGHRWAWRVALIWAGVFGGFGLASLVLIGFVQFSGMQDVTASHPLELAAGTLSVICLLASLVFLGKTETRDFFDPRPRT